MRYVKETSNYLRSMYPLGLKLESRATTVQPSSDFSRYLGKQVGYALPAFFEFCSPGEIVTLPTVANLFEAWCTSVVKAEGHLDTHGA